jgi:hypothetical protein
MKFFRFLSHALPLTLGVMFTLISLSFLVEFLDRGLDFEEEFFAFVFWFVIGFPLLLSGTNRIAKWYEQGDA